MTYKYVDDGVGPPGWVELEEGELIYVPEGDGPGGWEIYHKKSDDPYPNGCPG